MIQNLSLTELMNRYTFSGNIAKRNTQDGILPCLVLPTFTLRVEAHDLDLILLGIISS
jgi:hypothetical protein